ncbi:twin-arginine translocation signal domain-containing protein [Draconibacterium sediminis]
MKRRQFLKTSAAAGLVTMITPSGLLYSCKKTLVTLSKDHF